MKRMSARLTIVFALLCFIVLVCIGLATGWLYNSYMTQEKRRQFEQIATESLRHYKRYNDAENKDTVREEMNAALGGMGAMSDSRIIIVKVYLDRLDLVYDENMREYEIESGGEYLLAGDLRTIIAKRAPVFHNRVNWLSHNKSVMFYATYLLTESRDEYSFVLIYGSPHNVEQAMSQMWGMIWAWTALATIATAILAYIISKRIARPLIHMSKAARALAEGDEVDDIIVASKDEVGLLAAAFNRMKRTLASTERMRRNFLANVSHDMRTPLTSMLGLLEGLRAGWVPEENRAQVLDTLKSETERLVRLTGDILALARMQGGAIQLHPTSFPLDDLLHEVRQALDPEREFLKLASSELVVYADRAQLQRAIYNIAQNAVKYGKGDVEIWGEESEGRYAVTIRDHGEGIPPEQLEQLFDRFFRGDKARGGGGSGLGLSIAKEIVRLHGGDIEVESGPKGSTFVVWWPLAQSKKGRGEEK